MYSLQRVLLIILYLISIFSIAWVIFYILHDLLEMSGVYIILSSIVYIVLVVILYSFIHVSTYIPANLPGAFDPLKNDIARQKIKSGKELAGRLAEFMVNFFNFAFFDIEYALVNIKDESNRYPEEFFGDKDHRKLDQLDMKNRESEDTFYMGKIKTGRGNFHLYITPLVFGEARLGYIAVLSRNRIWKIFRRLLAEFENDFIDDQVVHVLGMNPGQGTLTK